MGGGRGVIRALSKKQVTCMRMGNVSDPDFQGMCDRLLDSHGHGGRTIVMSAHRGKKN